MQFEAGAWGILKAVNDAFVNPLLLLGGAGSLALGIYNSGANLFGFGSGWLGPRLAGRVGSSGKTVLLCLTFARTVFAALVAYLLLAHQVRATVIIPLVFLWGIGEGLALPLWTSFIAGLVGAGERGRWLAARGTAATLSTIPVMVGVVLLFLFASKERALPLAYGVAAVAGVGSLFLVRRLLRLAGSQPVPPARSVHSLPPDPAARRFLGGVFVFWFGSALAWPVLPRYIINDLHAPTAYFAVSQLIAAVAGVIVQRRWGRLSDESGPTKVLLLSGIGASIVPVLWAVVPFFWLGFGVDVIAQSAWPGHMLGLTLRSVELAGRESERASLLGWTNLAQGGGACISPLLASIAVSHTGTVPILLLSGGLRFLGIFVLTGFALKRPRLARLPG
ncbi:MAG: MFS transporter [Thermomicrobiales bacterium]